MGGETVADWMRNNVLQEEDAVNQYQEHIKLIDDVKIKRLLKRILSDEESHHGDFQHFGDKAQKQRAKDLRGTRQDRMTQILNWGIEHEYTVVLQYMFHSYMTTNKEAKKALADRAINEMQHLGWLSEKMVDSGGSPRIEHTEVDQSTKTADMLRADIEVEQEVATEYDHAAEETEDPDLKKLFRRISNHEKYHTEVFSDLLKEEEQQG